MSTEAQETTVHEAESMTPNLPTSRILITGGTGFIGSRLALACLQSGHTVTILGQQNTPAESQNRELLEQEGCNVVLASVTEPEKLDAACCDIDIVFHLAAAQHEMNVPDDRFWDVNVEGTKNLLEAAVRAGVKCVVHASTIGVYGSMRGTIDEASPCQPDNIYGVTKLEGEAVALSFKDRLGVVVVRVPEVYGPGDRRLVKLFKPISKRSFFIIGSGDNLHHPIYIDDLIRGLLQAAAHSDTRGRVFLLAGKQPVTTREMAVTIAEQIGVPPPKLRVPMFPFVVAAALLEATLRPLGIQPPLHRRRLDFFRKSFSLSSRLASETFGFTPQVDFARGARFTAEWYRQMGYL